MAAYLTDEDRATLRKACEVLQDLEKKPLPILVKCEVQESLDRLSVVLGLSNGTLKVMVNL